MERKILVPRTRRKKNVLPEKETAKKALPELEKTTKHLRLFDLPQELQDVIFERAYPEKSDLEIVFKDDWNKDQLRKRMRDDQYIASSFSSLQVNQWLVSKRFFLAAARAWFDTQNFECGPIPVGHGTPELFLLNCIALFKEFTSSVRLKMSHMIGVGFNAHLWPSLGACQRVKRLTIRLDWGLFESADKKFPWQIALSREELERALEKVDREIFGGIQNLRVVLEDNFAILGLVMDDQQKQMLVVNTALLEQIMREYTLKPRSKSVADRSPANDRKLYPGSKVHCDTPNGASIPSDQADSTTDSSDMAAVLATFNAISIESNNGNDDDSRKDPSFKETSARATSAGRVKTTATEFASQTKSPTEGALVISFIADNQIQESFSELVDFTGDAADWDPTALNAMIWDWISQRQGARGVAKKM